MPDHPPASGHAACRRSVHFAGLRSPLTLPVETRKWAGPSAVWASTSIELLLSTSDAALAYRASGSSFPLKRSWRAAAIFCWRRASGSAASAPTTCCPWSSATSPATALRTAVGSLLAINFRCIPFGWRHPCVCCLALADSPSRLAMHAGQLSTTCERMCKCMRVRWCAILNLEEEEDEEGFLAFLCRQGAGKLLRHRVHML